MVLLPLRIWRGQTRVWRFTVWEIDTDERKDLSVYEDIEFQVKRATGDADPALISKALGTGVELLTQSGDTIGQLEVTAHPIDTAGDPDALPTPTTGLDEGIYSYDLWGIIGTERYLLARPADFVVEDVVNAP